MSPPAPPAAAVAAAATPTTFTDLSSAPADILTAVLSHLSLLPDRLRFSAVCRSFNSALSSSLPPPTNPPFLLLPSASPTLHSLPETRSYPLPSPQTSRILGASSSNLIIVDSFAALHIINPLSLSTTPLPPTSTLPGLTFTPDLSTFRFPSPYPSMSYTLHHMVNNFFTKLILSPNIVAAIYKAPERIAVARVGGEHWSVVEMPYIGFKDIVFWDGVLYGVNYLGRVVRVEFMAVGGERVEEVGEGFGMVALPPLKYISKYLVVCGGELLQVWRMVRRCRVDGDGDGEEFGFCTRMWSVLKMDVGRKEWVEVRGIGENALFLGQGESVAVSTKEFPEVRGNCIYFTDDYNVGAGVPHRGRDLGVYDLESGRIDPIWSSSEAHSDWPPPIWFTPTLS